MKVNLTIQLDTEDPEDKEHLESLIARLDNILIPDIDEEEKEKI
tara:strand:+ start:789 stop:920 length:132 start_codon:yes stop_codon:yes gene_type:complete